MAKAGLSFPCVHLTCECCAEVAAAEDEAMGEDDVIVRPAVSLVVCMLLCWENECLGPFFF